MYVSPKTIKSLFRTNASSSQKCTNYRYPYIAKTAKQGKIFREINMQET